MTDKLKCPFCQQELIREGMNHWWCSCNIEHQGKELYGTTALWEALIQAKQDLEIAREALEVATDFIGFVNTSRHADGALTAMAIVKLNEITSITKQEI